MSSGVQQKFISGRHPLLELCPFCGEPAEMNMEKDGIVVECSNGECPFKPKSREHYDSEVRALKAWNTRKGGTP